MPVADQNQTGPLAQAGVHTSVAMQTKPAQELAAAPLWRAKFIPREAVLVNQRWDRLRAPGRCQRRAGAILAGLLVLLASRALAVDPLPPAIENASLATKESYWQQAGEESDRLRRLWGRRRYEERRRYRQDVAMTMYRAAEDRRELLRPQAPTPNGSDVALAPAGASPLPSRALHVGLLCLAAGLAYCFRERLFRKFYA